MTSRFDSIVIGAGQAGPTLSSRLVAAGEKVALIEKGWLGGTCVNVGCTPTKALVANARAIQQTRRGDEMGFSIPGDVAINMPHIKARTQEIVLKSRSGLEKWLGEMEHLTLLRGTASFVSSHTLQVNGEHYEADKIFLNVGARPTIPNLPGVDSVPYLTSTTILDLDTIPEHLVVVGGSYVGLEFAQIFRRLGAKVTVVERGSRLVSHEDLDVSDAVAKVLTSEGIDLRLDAECIRLERADEKVLVHVSCHTDPPTVTASHVLLAVGRTPNNDLLALDKAGIQLDPHGYIQVDDQLRTNVTGIWALGDCNGHGAFTHTSYNDYEIVAANLLDGDSRKLSDRIPVHALYIDPPLGQIGMTEEQVRKTGKPALIGTRAMTRVARATERGETQGFIKILVDKESQLILGASILGTEADEAIHCILTAMYARKPISLLQRSMHIHPTIAELIPTTAQDLKQLQ
ncbi:FAD-containing oxidoreductase [Terracidiphilus sp.]|jgi:pyruvate/2-oxoglutarate dehydrogenase complex dihydrolipoamide dehydrogenase (E3) component|uniref:FAD-containing oxidoreductase n=1 Tax=Terracidiphilus sp. TaxID=1964191 RepID=UPI003C1705FE